MEYTRMSWSTGIYEPIKDHTQEKSYLVQNQDVRGVGEPYAVPATFREASLPVDPTKLYGSITTLSMAAIPSPIIGKYIQLPDGTISTPGLGFASDPDTGIYNVAGVGFGITVDGAHEVTFNSSGIAIADLTPNRLALVGVSGQLVDNAAFTYSLSGDTTLIAAGDLRSGGAAVQRMFYDYSDQSLSIYDSSNNQDILLKANGDSWYNGSGNFGFGTITPDVKVDIEATATQLRLTYSSGSIYTDISTQSNGNLYLSPIGSSNRAVYMDLDMPGGDVLFYIANADDSSTSSHARIMLESSIFSGTGGDPLIEWATDPFGSDTHFVMGIDNSDSDKLKISSGTALGTTDRLTISTAGLVTITQYLNIGTATDASAQGDIGAGISGSHRWYYDQSAAEMVNFALAATASFRLDTSTPQVREVKFMTNGSLRWVIRTDGTAESGSDAGSNFFFNCRSDAGADKFTPISIYRVGGTAANAGLVFNEPGADYDCRFEGDTDPNLLLCDASTDRVGVGTSGPDAKLDVLSTATQLRLTYTDGSVYSEVLTDSSGNTTFSNTGSQASYTQSRAGSTLQMYVYNSDAANAASHAQLGAVSGGVSGGDPYILFSVVGGSAWSFGIDNSASDMLKVSAATTIGTSDCLTITTGGIVTIAQTLVVGTSEGTSLTQHLGVFNAGTATIGWRDTTNDVEGAVQAASSGVFIGAATNHPFNIFANSTVYWTCSSGGLITTGVGGWIGNEPGADVDFRWESDDESYCLMVEGTLNNIVLCANAEPGFNSMDGGVFLAEANVVPSGNPTGGGYIYVESGALKYRGTSGTITTLGPA
jgi:hypothetical protein